MTTKNINFVYDVWADKNPTNIAFVDNVASYTYGQFDEYVNRYTAVLAAQGIQKGDMVGILLHNCTEYIITFFALTRLGAVMVPINYMFSETEIEYIVKDANLKCIHSSREVNVSCPVISYMDIRKAADALPSNPGQNDYQGDSDDTVAIIYTSGTTGHPKGAMLTHTNFLSNMDDLVTTYGFTESDRFIGVLPLYHCFGFTAAALLTLSSGASTYLLKTFNPGEVVRTIMEQKLTILILVPPMYLLFTQMKNPDAFKSVRMAIAGGAALPKAIAEAFEDTYGLPVVEGYGLSEATAVVSANRPDNHKFYSIGLPLHHIKVKTVKADGSLCKTGEIGELLVQAPNVMKGYLNLPEETAKTIKDGWLCTGDMAYLDQEGFLYIVDRVKDMINLNGENIYPREIENQLYMHPDIAEVAVVGRHDPLRGEVVWAYVVMKEGRELVASELRSFLKGKLATFKIPRGFTALESLPKNSTGKILKRLLR